MEFFVAVRGVKLKLVGSLLTLFGEVSCLHTSGSSQPCQSSIFFFLFLIGCQLPVQEIPSRLETFFSFFNLLWMAKAIALELSPQKRGFEKALAIWVIANCNDLLTTRGWIIKIWIIKIKWFYFLQHSTFFFHISNATYLYFFYYYFVSWLSTSAIQQQQ